MRLTRAAESVRERAEPHLESGTATASLLRRPSTQALAQPSVGRPPSLVTQMRKRAQNCIVHPSQSELYSATPLHACT
jgi:hypothetical protein